MAYYRNITITDIKDWELGLQDGFKRKETNSYTNYEDFKGLDIPDRIKKTIFKDYLPFVDTGIGPQVLEKKSDKIATRLDGTRFVLTKEQFEEYYHSDSGMFEPDLNKHAEFEYVVQQFGKLRNELKVLKEGLDYIEDPATLKEIRKQVDGMVNMSDGFLQNLKSEAEQFLDRVKGCTCRDS